MVGILCDSECNNVYYLPMHLQWIYTIHWKDIREFMIYTKHLFIPQWLSPLRQEHVNDGIHQKKCITSPGCQNDPLAEIGARGALMTYCSPQIVLSSSCSRGHCGVTVGGCVVWGNRVKFLWAGHIVQGIAKSLTELTLNHLHLMVISRIVSIWPRTFLDPRKRFHRF